VIKFAIAVDAATVAIAIAVVVVVATLDIRGKAFAATLAALVDMLMTVLCQPAMSFIVDVVIVVAAVDTAYVFVCCRRKKEVEKSKSVDIQIFYKVQLF